MDYQQLSFLRITPSTLYTLDTYRWSRDLTIQYNNIIVDGVTLTAYPSGAVSSP